MWITAGYTLALLKAGIWFLQGKVHVYCEKTVRVCRCLQAL